MIYYYPEINLLSKLLFKLLILDPVVIVNVVVRLCCDCDFFIFYFLLIIFYFYNDFRSFSIELSENYFCFFIGDVFVDECACCFCYIFFILLLLL